MPKTILAVAVNPKDTPRLRLDEEIREIENCLRGSKYRSEFVLAQIWAVRPFDLRRAMLDHKPQFIHFCGHGSNENGLAFEDREGNSKIVDAVALSEFFRLFSPQVKCVLLNACFSETQADAISQYVDFVIGMKKGISDDAAIEFAAAFYDAIGAGKDVDFAYKIACNAIHWSAQSGNPMPEIKNKRNCHQNQIVEVTNSGEDNNRAAGKDFLNQVQMIVQSLTISAEGKIFLNKEYEGKKQPGFYKIDIALEANIDSLLPFLMMVDCKKWNAEVDIEHIQKVVQTRDAISAHKAICVSQVGFTDDAVTLAEAQGIGLWMYAKREIEFYGGGGPIGLSPGIEMSTALASLFYSYYQYSGQYHKKRPQYLVPYQWIREYQLKNKGKSLRYEVSNLGNSRDPVIAGLMQYIYLNLDTLKDSTICDKVKKVLLEFSDILREAGMKSTAANDYLREVVRISIVGGYPFVKYNGDYALLDKFDRSLNHKRTPLIMPDKRSLQKQAIWENAIWLFGKWKKENAIDQSNFQFPARSS